MIIIAFTNHTSKILPRILCRRYRHCAPIAVTPHGMVMYQFVRPGKIVKIPLAGRDIKILGTHGWQFIYVARDIPSGFNPRNAKTCVGLSRCAIGLRAWHIQTPYGLYKYLHK